MTTSSADPGAGSIRAGIARLLRGEGVPARAGVARPSRREGEEAGLVVRRPVAEIFPDGDVDAALDGALARLGAADPETIDPALRPAAGMSADDLVVLDLETAGFWGCPIFLVGTLHREGGRLVTQQFLARDYPDEAKALADAARLLGTKRVVVTFNGKSYDAPCLAERMTYHRLAGPPVPSAHVDVLHPSRRRWSEELPDCRLQTLETWILGLRRTGDVPSAEIPALYHRFTATQREDELRPVLHHSRIDLLTTLRLFVRLCPAS